MYKTLEHNSSSLESIARSSRAFIRSFRLCLGGRFFFPSLGLGVPARLEEAVDYALVSRLPVTKKPLRAALKFPFLPLQLMIRVRARAWDSETGLWTPKDGLNDPCEGRITKLKAIDT